MPNPDPKILVRRGTELQRTDGTLGTPDQGELCYTTDTKALVIGDGATSGGTPATKHVSAIMLMATTTQNINALATDNLVTWNQQIAYYGTDFTHSTSSNPERILINTAGWYEFSANLALDATASTPTRYNGKMRMSNQTTGGKFGPEGKGGYLREASGQDETSLHIATFIYEISAGTTVQLAVDREASTTAAVDTTARKSSLYIRRVA